MSNLIFNEQALNHLLQSPEGAVGTRLRFIAEKVETNYNAAVDRVWEFRSPDARPTVSSDITFGDLGIQAEIGLVDTHGKTRVNKDGTEIDTTAWYMAKKFNNAAEGWAVEMIMAGWADPI